MMATNLSAPANDGVELVTIGRVARAHGRRGEIVVDALTDDPARFGELDRLFVRCVEGGIAGGAPAAATSVAGRSSPSPSGQEMGNVSKNEASHRGTEEILEIEAARVHKGRPLLKLGGVNSIDEAQRLAGRELAIPASEEKPLDEGGYYHFQLVGLTVEDTSGTRLGRVASVLSTGGTDVLVVEREEREMLVPLCREHCPEIDIAAGRVVVSLPDGLWDA